MNLQRRIARLNRVLGDKFGYVDGPQGRESKFAWKYTGEIYYFIDEGYDQTPDGLNLPTRNYTRHAWSERIGPRWVLCAWRPPEMTREQWLEKIQDQFPYPANGRFLPINGTELDPRDEPDEYINEYVIGRLLAQKESSFSELLAASTAAAKKDADERKARFEGEFDEMWPAFNKDEPGSRGEHVEFQAGIGESRRFGGLQDGSDH